MKILRTPEAARKLGVSQSLLEKLRVYGGGPRFVKLGTRAVGYRPEDLEQWLEQRVRRSTSEPSEAVERAART